MPDRCTARPPEPIEAEPGQIARCFFYENTKSP
jgi:hypothetical protein